MQVGADQVAAADALEAVASVVAVAPKDPAQRLGGVAEVGAAAVVLEAGDLDRAVAEVGLDRDVADQPRAGVADRLEVDQREPRIRSAPS